MEKYIKPTMTVVDVEIQSILAASPMSINPEETNEFDRAKDQAFGFNVWGDDED